ncbi:carbohydrate ABC transporter substrate-binding protein (CUT1 family) [Pseudonocardia hierapolitana]|uniref:Carbohydrate ABC transporter substrate-binding protein (CUT1 family) n=1 Tax=Pseudonocardia hierapolitana TaxID=1128676 RepID=A0A561SMK4_9PSEU|nr:extracellular solute-binding protein [Pseudonocardia hierapolitana]TWF76076.1 carbohydrate ABC transporter substrate-binding protein (CUT1 family) [Pseudonocardia hierapolitana]
MTSRPARTRRAAVAALVGALGLLAACTPGSENAAAPPPTDRAVQTDIASLGPVTLTVWDQEVRGGQNEQMERLNAAFQQQYPNVTIKRDSRSFDDLATTLRLALSGNDAPDVVQANNGRADMGAFVAAGELLPLEPWSRAYGWDQRYPDSVRQYVSYTPDGKVFGEGEMYGLPQVGEVVGIYYNPAELQRLGIAVPTTWEEFEAALAAVKAGGATPLALGNVESWPALHVFGTVQDQLVPADQITDLAFGRAGASWTTPENTQAAQRVADWARAGYFNEGVNGIDDNQAWQAFSRGEAVFLIGGSWYAADLEAAMGQNVRFMPPPPPAGRPVSATGGTGLPFAITSASDAPDAAAAYLDFITSSDAMRVLTETGNLPVVDTAAQTPPAGLSQDVFAAFAAVADDGQLLPYLDYATPTMGDTMGAALQDLLSGAQPPEAVLSTVEADYAAFVNR